MSSPADKEIHLIDFSPLRCFFIPPRLVAGCVSLSDGVRMTLSFVCVSDARLMHFAYKLLGGGAFFYA